MGLPENLQGIKSKENTIEEQEKGILSNLFDSEGSFNTKKIVNNKQKFLNAIKRLESKINEIETEIGQAEEEIYRREENEFQELSDISDARTNIENNEKELFEDIINMMNEVKSTASKRGSKTFSGEHIDLDSSYEDENITGKGTFPSNKFLKEVNYFKKDVWRIHSILTTIEDIEELEEEENIPALNMIDEELGHLRLEKEKLDTIINNLENIEGRKDSKIQELERNSKQLSNQMRTVIQQSTSLKERGSEVQNYTLQNVEKIISDINKLKNGNTQSPRDVARFFAEIKANKGSFGPEAGSLNGVKKSEEINEALKKLIKGIDQVEKEAEQLQEEILRAKNFYDNGDEHSAGNSQHQTAENIGKAT